MKRAKTNFCLKSYVLVSSLIFKTKFGLTFGVTTLKTDILLSHIFWKKSLKHDLNLIKVHIFTFISKTELLYNI